MAMDKRWQQIFDRLDAIEAAIKAKDKPANPVTKADLVKIKGVGDALAEEILKLINS